MKPKTVWKTEDRDGVRGELTRTDPDVWILDLIENGDIMLEMNRQQLKELRDVIDAELMTDEG